MTTRWQQRAKAAGVRGKICGRKEGKEGETGGEGVSPRDTALCGWHPLESHTRHTRQTCDTDRQCETARCKWADTLQVGSRRQLSENRCFPFTLGMAGVRRNQGQQGALPPPPSLFPPWGGSPPHLALRAEEDTGGVPLPRDWQPLEAPCVP